MLDLATVVKAYDIRGIVDSELDARLVFQFGAAFAWLMRNEGDTVVAVGRDMRDSSPVLARSFIAGVTTQGVDVMDIGLASTDQLYFASGSLSVPGAMFTASHNPAQYNGIKLCRSGATPIGIESGLAEIRAAVERGVPAYTGIAGRVVARDVLAQYADHLRSLVDLSRLRRLKVVVDAGNGMASHTAPAVLSDLPIHFVPLYCRLDGSFPHHEPNPLDPQNLVDLQAMVRKLGADVGLAFDGDADRCFVVDEHGMPVSPSSITALIAVRHLAREPGATIIHNLITSRAVPEIVAEHGGIPLRTRVGHAFIKATMAETNAIFAGEHSGHYYFREFWRADTGMLAALHLIAAVGEQNRPLSALACRYQRYAASGEINSRVSDQEASLLAVKRTFADRPGVTIDELDGLTVELPDRSWFNVRASNTEPLLRLNVEGPNQATVDALTDRVLAILPV